MTVENFLKEVLPLKNKIFRFAKRLLDRHAEAEDITQDVFIKLWSNKEQISEYRNVEAVAMTITKNICLDKLKSKNIRPAELKDNDMLQTASDPHRDTELTDSRSLMRSIINTLPEQQKIIVQLREIEGYEFDEIETITGLNMNVIRVNLSRARKTIREQLVKQYNHGIGNN